MSKMKVAQDGPGKDLPKNSAQAVTLEAKIEIAKDLQRKIRAREVFNAKLMEVAESEKDLQASELEAWESEKGFRVILESGEYSKKPVLSFTQRGLIEKFLEFIKIEIEAKLKQIEESINSVKL